MRTRVAFSPILGVLLGAGCGAPSDRAPRAYVTNEADGTVSVIDLHRLEVVSTITTGGHPRGLAIAPSGEALYVAMADPDRIALVDLETEEALRALSSGPGPERFDLFNTTMVVANTQGAAIVDASAGTVRATVEIGAEPSSVAVAPDETVWVTSAAAGEVAVIDTSYSERIARISVGERPRALAFDHTGARAYVANEGGTVSVIDVATRAVAETIEIAGHPTAVALSASDDRLYVATGDGGGVAVIDPATDELERTIAIPGATPRALAVGGDGRVYAASHGSDDVTVLDPATGAVVARIAVGGQPAAIVVER